MTRFDRVAMLIVAALAIAIATVATVATVAAAQQAPASSASAGLLSRKTTAVTHEARRDTNVHLVGTPLLPRARGEAPITTGSSGPVQLTTKIGAHGEPPPTS